MLDETTTKKLRKAIRTWGEANTPLVIGQQQACFDAVEFLLNAHVHVCLADVAVNETAPDGPGVTRWHKVRMVSRAIGPSRPYRRTVRTILVTTNPFAQLLRSFCTFEWDQASRLSQALKSLIPKERWAELAEGLTIKMAELKEDPVRQAALDDKLAAARRKIFEREREALIRDIGRLQRRGWTKDQVDECWDEALVKDVMES